MADVATADVPAATRLPRCACGNVAMAFAPRTAPIIECGIVLDAGKPVRAWCLDCWRAAGRPWKAKAL